MAIDLTEEWQLLEDPEPDYKKLLQCLCALERRYSEITTRIKVGLSENIKDSWEIIKITDLITQKINTRLEKTALMDDAKINRDLIKIVQINEAINNKIMSIIEGKK